jgi:hypothetical protein
MRRRMKRRKRKRKEQEKEGEEEAEEEEEEEEEGIRGAEASLVPSQSLAFCLQLTLAASSLKAEDEQLDSLDTPSPTMSPGVNSCPT